MKILENMDLCYGCGACDNICPKNAITMKPAEDGFLYPEIDETVCINCNACKTVCPQLNAEYENSKKPSVYAVMANDEIRAKSASGGVFTVLAEYAFQNDGYVCGAEFSDDFRSVKHAMIDKHGNLDKLRRSKYMQSENGDIYKQIKDKLENGKFVLFVGTPCQCAAVKSYLRKPYDNLILVDLICHGTPSSYVWNKFLDEIAPNKEIKDVNFRYKGLIGWSSTTHIEFKDGTEYTQRFANCKFEQAFSKNLVSRKSCGTCQFARTPRQGDITMGDFWGVEKSLDDRKGTSVLLVNTEKGKMVFDKINQQNQFITVKDVSFYRAFSRNNSNIYRFSQTNPGRPIFFNELNNGKKFSEALNASKSEKYDIMLFSIWYAANFGSMMTNFALYKTLSDMGYNCIFADIPDHLWPESIVHRNPRFITRRFGYKHFNLTRKYKDRADLKNVNELADTFIVGSDQIWNYNLCKSAGTYFYLDFVDDDKKKIAYGTSFGHSSFRGNNEERKTAGYYLNRFDAVSVREDYAVDLCKSAFGVDAVQVLDPVFMCNKEHYLKCIEESEASKNPPAKKYVLAYILDPTEEKQYVLEETAKRLGAELLCIPNAQVKDDLRARWRLPILEDIDMEDWLYYFKNAEMVVTDSFHGSCFSIIFERQFVAIGNEKRGLERFHSLLNELGLVDKLVLSASEIFERDSIFTEAIDYSKVNAKIEELRKTSMNWLKDALHCPSKPPIYSSYDLTDRYLDKTVKRFDREVNDLKKEMKELQLVAKQNKQILAEIEKCKKYKDKIDYMENSISWKITKPLRAFVKLIKKVLKK